MRSGAFEGNLVDEGAGFLVIGECTVASHTHALNASVKEPLFVTVNGIETSLKAVALAGV